MMAHDPLFGLEFSEHPFWLSVDLFESERSALVQNTFSLEAFVLIIVI
jgi:hypothetical protein